MKVLITGGAGFVGSHLADRLLAREHEVLVIDNFATGRRDNLKPHARLEVVEGSIADRALMDRTFGAFKPEFVVHAAASYKDPEAWEEDARTNAVGTANVVQSSEKIGAKRLVYFQTALCYGLKPLEQPITLSHPILPDGSSYAISKTAGEQYVRLGKVDWVSFRLANAYGPRNLSGPLPTFYSRLTTGKTCFCVDTRRDFIFVDDVVEVVMRAIGGAGKKGAYHVSSGGDFSIKQLFDATVAALGIKLDKDVEVKPRGEDDVFTILLDPSATHRDFNGWTTTMQLEEGVAKTIAYYREHGITQTFTHLKPIEK